MTMGERWLVIDGAMVWMLTLRDQGTWENIINLIAGARPITNLAVCLRHTLTIYTMPSTNFLLTKNARQLWNLMKHWLAWTLQRISFVEKPSKFSQVIIVEIQLQFTLWWWCLKKVRPVNVMLSSRSPLIWTMIQQRWRPFCENLTTIFPSITPPSNTTLCGLMVVPASKKADCLCIITHSGLACEILK